VAVVPVVTVMAVMTVVSVVAVMAVLRMLRVTHAVPVRHPLHLRRDHREQVTLDEAAQNCHPSVPEAWHLTVTAGVEHSL
jgi:hypothetical protein